jgi:hypothetical protein
MTSSPPHTSGTLTPAMRTRPMPPTLGQWLLPTYARRTGFGAPGSPCAPLERADHQHGGLITKVKPGFMIPDRNPRIWWVSVRDHGNLPLAGEGRFRQLTGAPSVPQRRQPGGEATCHSTAGPERQASPISSMTSPPSVCWMRSIPLSASTEVASSALTHSSSPDPRGARLPGGLLRREGFPAAGPPLGPGLSAPSWAAPPPLEDRPVPRARPGTSPLTPAGASPPASDPPRAPAASVPPRPAAALPRAPALSPLSGTPPPPPATSPPPPPTSRRVPVAPARVPVAPARVPVAPARVPVAPARLPVAPARLPVAPGPPPLTSGPPGMPSPAPGPAGAPPLTPDPPRAPPGVSAGAAPETALILGPMPSIVWSTWPRSWS